MRTQPKYRVAFWGPFVRGSTQVDPGRAFAPHVLRETLFTGGTMEFDDGVRSKHGLAVCLRDMGDGTSRLFVDDVVHDASTDPPGWSHDWFVTFSPPITNARLDECALTDRELQDIGLLVVSRLVAVDPQRRPRGDT